MWDIIDKCSYKLFINKNIELKLKVVTKDNYSEVYVNYKGYNVVFQMEVWEFGYECREWDIHEKMIGNPVTDPVGMHFIVDLKDTGAFIDLIYFFLNENGCDGMLRKECFINHLI